MTAPLMLEVSNLKKSFGSVIVANGFDLEVRTGEALGILGPNGAGKTTFFNMIAGIAPPDSGQIKLDVDATLPRRRRMNARMPELAARFKSRSRSRILPFTRICSSARSMVRG